MRAVAEDREPLIALRDEAAVSACVSDGGAGLVRAALERARSAGSDLEAEGSGDGVGTGDVLRSLVQRVVVRQGALDIHVNAAAALGEYCVNGAEMVASVPLYTWGGGSKSLVIGGVATEVGVPNEAVVALLDRAHQWFGRLRAEGGDALSEIAREANLSRSYVTHVVQLALFSPRLQIALREGNVSAQLTAERLLRLLPLP